MDVLVLIDKLDDLVHNAKAVPLTDQVRILQEAREQAVREASQTEIVKLAERQAQEIIDESRRQAREMRLEMEDWADGMLATLENNLDKFLSAVRRGRDRLHERSQETVVAGIGPIEVPADDTSSVY